MPKKLLKALKAGESTIIKCLKAIGMMQKPGQWKSYGLKETNIVKYLTICELLLLKTQTKVLISNWD